MGVNWGYLEEIMINLIEKLKVIAVEAHETDAPVIEAAIKHIDELEAKLATYEDDITDWQGAVGAQMRRRKDDR